MSQRKNASNGKSGNGHYDSRWLTQQNMQTQRRSSTTSIPRHLWSSGVGSAAPLQLESDWRAAA